MGTPYKLFYGNCDVVGPDKSLLSTSTVTKRTLIFYTLLILGALFTRVSATRNEGNCPSACSCNKEHIVFCNNKGLNITPIGFKADVERLYLFNNNISSILPATLRTLQHLKILDISGNRLSDIALWDGIFTNLKLLENLMLQKNQITRINRGMFMGLSNLARIYLHENLIETIEPGAFDILPNLIELKLRSNKISRFPRLNHTPNLLLLDLGNNQLTTLKDMSFSTLNVEQLMLQSNKLTELRTSVFDDTSRLTLLDVSNNRLSAIPQVIKSLTSLRSLNVSLNRMESKTIPQDTFTNFKSLKSLYLRGMGLATLPSRLIPTSNIILNEIDLSENEWDCRCKMRWMPEYLRTFEAAVISLNKIVCSDSSRLPGRIVKDLQESDFICTREELQALANGGSITSPPPTTSSGRNSFINPCDVYFCGNGGSCYVERNRPKCRCAKGWSGPRCWESLTTSTPRKEKSATTTAKVSAPNKSPSHNLVIKLDSVTEDAVEIFIPKTNVELLLSISEIGQRTRPNEFVITPKLHQYKVQNLEPGRSYKICVHDTFPRRRHAQRSYKNRDDALCGTVKTNGVKVENTPSSKPEITVVPSPKVTTKHIETPSKTSRKISVSYSEPGYDQKLHGSKITPQTEPSDTEEFNMLYPAVGAGIGAVVVIIVIVMFCICKRQKRLVKLKKGSSLDYTPGTVSENHNDLEMATVVHHHHHNHYNAGSIEQGNSARSDKSSPSSTIQNGITPSKIKASPTKTNNNHSIVQSKSSRSSSRSSGVSQPDTRYTSVQPYLATQNAVPKYESQNGLPNGYVYRGHDGVQDQTRHVARQLSQRPQTSQNKSNDTLFPGGNSYYGTNDSHLYPVSPLNAPSYGIPTTGPVPYNAPTHNAHALFQPIQSPMGASTNDTIPGLSHRMANSHGMPPPMACLTRNLVMENMQRYHEGVQVV